jgi:hypothetical protein
MLPIDQEKILQNIINKSYPFWEREIKCYSNFHFQTNTKYGYDRKDAINNLSKELIYYEPTHIKRLNTWLNQIKYSFVISPHGNGLDCHRTWEALVLGCIPIVKTSALDEIYNDLPVLIVQEWKDVTEQLLNDTINNYKNKQFNYEKLKLNYWIRKAKSYTNKIKLFNMDLHISVIEDVKTILNKLYGNKIDITEWTLSGHSWVFNKEKKNVEIINQYTWKHINKEMIEKFITKYYDILNKYDGFIVTHSPVFTLLYEKFNKPIILINSTRYEMPFSWQWNHNLEMWDYLTDKLKEMYNNKQLFVISNNKADYDYLKMATNIESIVIPSLCKYTNSTYKPENDKFIIYYDYSNIIKETNNIITKHNYVGNNYKYDDLYNCKGIIHVPYNISTMSFFEQYSANIPLFFPSKSLLKYLVLNNLIQFDARYNLLFDRKFKKYPHYLKNALDDDKYIDFFIDRADFYDNNIFKYITYYDNIETLENIINNTDTQEISKKMEKWNIEREEKIYNDWKIFFSQIFNII